MFTSVKGTLVCASAASNEEFVVCSADDDDVFGVVYETGVAAGLPTLVVFSAVAEVLLKDGTAATRGNWAKTSNVSGRADATLAGPPGGGIPEHDQHFREIGHCIESKIAGTNVLAKCVIHFN